jgi:hypothetical protein
VRAFVTPATDRRVINSCYFQLYAFTPRSSTVNSSTSSVPHAITSQHCVVGIATGRQRDRSSSLGRVESILFSTASRPAVGSTQSLIQWVPAAVSLGVKRQGREADHSSPTSAQLKKSWIYTSLPQKTNKLHGLSPRANYIDRATAASRRSNCQLLRIKGATWSALRIPPAVFLGFLDRSRYFSIK